MRTSQMLISTLRQAPKDAEVISHQLMLRSGMIRKLASGLYTWLPLGLRVLKKVEAVIREEMQQSGAQEVLMPAVQPAELWEESKRWEQYGPELLRFQDRHNRSFCYGPTHEEVITDLVRNEINSYKQLPITFFQIQTKFRDEIRPRYGIMRAREFLMKDAYSFHANQDCLESTYQVMYETYQRIFKRLELNFRAVLADTGSIGGNTSHEFHVLADSGEDTIAFSNQSDYAANIELAEAVATPVNAEQLDIQPKQLASTPHQKTIKDVATFLKADPSQILKTLIVKGCSDESPFVALIIRGDHTLNAIKAQKLPEIFSPLTLATESDIKSIINCDIGFIGPVSLSMPCIVDHSAANVVNFICGANQNDNHYINVNWNQDCTYTKTADLREINEGDPSPDGRGEIQLKRGIEVGHIFQLGTKYSEAMQASILNDAGKSSTLTMGCYGIGVSRIVAASIEQNHDEKGIIWPAPLAPFSVVIVPINYQKSALVKKASDDLYLQLKEANIDVLLDDRNERPGVKFSDWELIGIPHRLVISEKTLAENMTEYYVRRNDKLEILTISDVLEKLNNLSLL